MSDFSTIQSLLQEKADSTIGEILLLSINLKRQEFDGINPSDFDFAR
jgi:hypothetical protein